MSNPIDLVLSRLEAHLCAPRSTGNGKWRSRCPAHDGNHHNLSISEASDGTVGLRCHSKGCNALAIVHSLGLELRDLFPPSPDLKKKGGKPIAPASKPESKPKATPAKKPLTFRSEGELIKSPPKGFPIFKEKFEYKDINGKEVFTVYRFENQDGGKVFRPSYPHEGKRLVALPDGPKPLFRLPELIDAPRIWVVEGEKCVEKLRSMGLIATTSQGGANAPQTSDWSPLAGKELVLLPDADKPGERFTSKIFDICSNLDPKPRIKMVRLEKIWKSDSPIEEGFDVCDWAESGVPEHWTPEDLSVHLKTVVEQSKEASASDFEREQKVEVIDLRETAFDAMLNLTKDFDLWKTEDEELVASIANCTRVDHFLIESREMKRLLWKTYFDKTGRPLSTETIDQTIWHLGSKAYYSKKTRKFPIRVGGDADRVFYDLKTDETVLIVEVDRFGWQVREMSKEPFRRLKSLRPNATPVGGGSLDLFRELLNVPNDDDWILLVAWMACSIRPIHPYPVLILEGEQGSAKSTTARLIKLLIDPHVTPLRKEPKESRDLAIAAKNCWLMAFDNISKLQTWLSDGLCTLSTEGGFATRKLQTDDEEVYFSAARPILLNGIVDVATRGDLLSRTILLHLPAIPAEKRLEESWIWKEFELRKPRILGALFDALSAGMRCLDQVQAHGFSRSPDFERWGQAVWLGLKGSPERFVEAYKTRQQDAQAAAIESNPVAVAVKEFMDHYPLNSWEGTVAQLKYEIGRVSSESSLPKTERGLSASLVRSIPSLRLFGIEIDRGKVRDGRRLVSIKQDREKASPIDSF